MKQLLRYRVVAYIECPADDPTAIQDTLEYLREKGEVESCRAKLMRAPNTEPEEAEAE